jgi:anti-sigma regulatory factor (Ser/Thr protein kinase)
MKHGCGGSDLVVHVEIIFQAKQIQIKIQDQAKHFNPLEFKKVNLQKYFEGQPSVGGLGIHLVREMMDEIIYQRENGNNILIMKKNI